METSLPSPARLRSSVIAVPPLARNAAGIVDREQNAKIIQHITDGGVSHLLYGGNALFYHIRLSEYAAVLQMLSDLTDAQTCVVPSLGPAYGLMLDQIDVLKDFFLSNSDGPASKEIADQAASLRGFVERQNNWDAAGGVSQV